MSAGSFVGSMCTRAQSIQPAMNGTITAAKHHAAERCLRVQRYKNAAGRSAMPADRVRYARPAIIPAMAAKTQFSDKCEGIVVAHALVRAASPLLATLGVVSF